MTRCVPVHVYIHVFKLATRCLCQLHFLQWPFDPGRTSKSLWTLGYWYFCDIYIYLEWNYHSITNFTTKFWVHPWIKVDMWDPRCNEIPYRRSWNITFLIIWWMWGHSDIDQQNQIISSLSPSGCLCKMLRKSLKALTTSRSLEWDG